MSVFSLFVSVCPCRPWFVDCYIVAMQRSARTRSNRSCSMAFRCSRFMSLTFSCTHYHAGKEARRACAHVCRHRVRFVGALGGSIVYFGSYPSLACHSSSMCVIYFFFFVFAVLGPR